MQDLRQWYFYMKKLLLGWADIVENESVFPRDPIHVAGAHFWMPSFNLVIDDGDHSVSCNVQQYSKYGYITHHGLCCLHAKYHHTQLGYTVVMSIWNTDAQQRQSYLTWAKSCYIMLVSNKLSYMLVIIMLLSQDRVTTICTVKFKINNIAFIIKDAFEGQSNWNMD